MGMIKWFVLRCFRTSRTILITEGTANRFLEDLSLDLPRDGFFETAYETKAIRDDKWVVLSCFRTSRTILNIVGAANRLLEDLSPDILMY